MTRLSKSVTLLPPAVQTYDVESAAEIMSVTY